MPSLPAVSSGEILDMVVAPPAPRGDSASGGDRFEDVLDDASQGLGSEGTAPSPSVQPGKGKEPQGDAAPKAQGAEKPASQGESASTDTSAPDEGKPAPASSSEGDSQASDKPAEEGEGTTAASAEDEKKTAPGQEQAALIISQLIAAGVYGLTQLTDGAPVETGDENGLKLGTLAASSSLGPASSSLKQGQAAPGLALLAAGGGLAQGESAEAQAAAPQVAADEAAPQAVDSLAGAILAEDAGETVLAPVQTDAADEAPELAPQVVSIEGEALAAPAEEEAPQAGAAPLLDDGALPEEVVTGRDAWTPLAEAAPEETAEEAPAQPVAVAETDDAPEAAQRVDWTRWEDADGAGAPDEAAQTAAPAALFAGDGDFGQPANEDGPDGSLANRTAAVQASAEAQPRNAAPAGPASQPVDAYLRAEVHRQVMEAALSRMNIVLREGVAEARLQLDPPSLGRMHMELRMQDGAMHAKVTVETAWAKDAVMSGLKELRESLQRQGVSLENFSVDVRAGLNAGNFGQDRAANQGDGALYLEATPEEDAAYAPDRGPVFASSSLSGDGSINIFA